MYSLSSPSDCPSSTVITPSLPTFSITSAINSPTLGSAAEIDATDEWPEDVYHLLVQQDLMGVGYPEA